MAIELASKVGGAVSSIVAPEAEIEDRIDRLPARLGSYGVDPFGFDPQFVKKVVGLWIWIYRNYFRVQTFGVENIPDGRCLIIANHSGQLPFDAAMMLLAAFLEREPPRYLRSMLERFVPSTPYVSVFLARCGQILGTPENCRRLLDAGEAILVFPEGVRGLNKIWRERYQLQRFGHGFMRLALETETPLVPAVVIGAEEQAPSFANLRSVGKLIGMPSLPVTPFHPLVPGLGLMPLPTRYRIYFGEPMRFTGAANDEDEAIDAKVGEVKQTMQGMIEQGLKAREHVFW
jgi:1-acyl-sn-glycerol-3-phosphate acyltransferase